MTALRLCALAAIAMLTTACATSAGAQADKLSDRTWDACNNQRFTFSWQEEVEACSALIQAGISDQENLAIAYNNRGRGYMELHDDARALSDFDRATQLNPNLPDPFLNRGRIYSERGDIALAMAQYEGSIAVAPDNPYSYGERALVHFNQGDYQSALRDFEEAVRRAPDDAYFLYGRGAMRVRLGMRAEGEADMAAATARNAAAAQRMSFLNN